MAFLIPSGLRKCWIWKGFVAFDRTVNIQGIGIVVYCAGQAILAGVAFLLTQVSEDRLLCRSWSKRESASPAKAIVASFEPAPEIDPPKRLTMI